MSTKDVLLERAYVVTREGMECEYHTRSVQYNRKGLFKHKVTSSMNLLHTTQTPLKIHDTK